jgi:hypothetical protein
VLTKNIVIIVTLLIISLLFGLFWTVAPALMKDRLVGTIASANPARQCFNYYKNSKDYFKDPDSAYIESSYILTKEADKEQMSRYPLVFEMGYDSIAVVKVRAHNSMGGYVSDSIYCPYKESDSSANQIIYNIKESTYFGELDTKELCIKLSQAIDYYKPDAYFKEKCNNFGILLQ